MDHKGEPALEPKEHYTYVTRRAISLFNEGLLSNVVSIDVEPEYGYTTRLNYDNNQFRITYGNDLGLNSGTSNSLAQDKGHTKFLLNAIGIACPEGKEFILPWWAEAIQATHRMRNFTNIQTTDMAFKYLEDHLGYPAYVKPVSGSKGIGVNRVDNANEARTVFDSFEESKTRVAVVEAAIDMPDYRVVILDGELISAYQRKPLSVTGNGEDSIETLLLKTQQKYASDGRDTIIKFDDPRILQQLAKNNLSFTSKPEPSEEVMLTSVSNLSAGGTSIDVGRDIHQYWIEKAAFIARNFNLRLCGVDLACTDITDPESNYSVLEVNATPGLDHYASSGTAQEKIVNDLYTRVLNAYPTPATS